MDSSSKPGQAMGLPCTKLRRISACFDWHTTGLLRWRVPLCWAPPQPQLLWSRNALVAGRTVKHLLAGALLLLLLLLLLRLLMSRVGSRMLR